MSREKVIHLLGFQSTPLREGRPMFLRASIASSKFQSTPLREGRLQSTADVVLDNGFQSTPLREGRLKNQYIADRMQLVSIHAPARGATQMGGEHPR